MTPRRALGALSAIRPSSFANRGNGDGEKEKRTVKNAAVRAPERQSNRTNDKENADPSRSVHENPTPPRNVDNVQGAKTAERFSHVQNGAKTVERSFPSRGTEGSDFRTRRRDLDRSRRKTAKFPKPGVALTPLMSSRRTPGRRQTEGAAPKTGASKRRRKRDLEKLNTLMKSKRRPTKLPSATPATEGAPGDDCDRDDEPVAPRALFGDTSSSLLKSAPPAAKAAAAKSTPSRPPPTKPSASSGPPGATKASCGGEQNRRGDNMTRGGTGGMHSAATQMSAAAATRVVAGSTGGDPIADAQAAKPAYMFYVGQHVWVAHGKKDTDNAARVLSLQDNPRDPRVKIRWDCYGTGFQWVDTWRIRPMNDDEEVQEDILAAASGSAPPAKAEARIDHPPTAATRRSRRDRRAPSRFDGACEHYLYGGKTTGELKSFLTERELSTEGDHPELVGRLVKSIQLERGDKMEMTAPTPAVKRSGGRRKTIKAEENRKGNSEYLEMKVAKLKVLLKERGLKSTDTKSFLADRLHRCDTIECGDGTDVRAPTPAGKKGGRRGKSVMAEEKGCTTSKQEDGADVGPAVRDLTKREGGGAAAADRLARPARGLPKTDGSPRLSGDYDGGATLEDESEGQPWPVITLSSDDSDIAAPPPGKKSGGSVRMAIIGGSDENEYERMTIAKLKPLLKERGLSMQGKQSALVDRLHRDDMTQIGGGVDVRVPTPGGRGGAAREKAANTARIRAGSSKKEEARARAAPAVRGPAKGGVGGGAAAMVDRPICPPARGQPKSDAHPAGEDGAGATSDACSVITILSSDDSVAATPPKTATNDTIGALTDATVRYPDTDDEGGDGRYPTYRTLEEFGEHCRELQLARLEQADSELDNDYEESDSLNAEDDTGHFHSGEADNARGAEVAGVTSLTDESTAPRFLDDEREETGRLGSTRGEQSRADEAGDDADDDNDDETQPAKIARFASPILRERGAPPSPRLSLPGSAPEADDEAGDEADNEADDEAGDDDDDETQPAKMARFASPILRKSGGAPPPRLPLPLSSVRVRSGRTSYGSDFSKSTCFHSPAGRTPSASRSVAAGGRRSNDERTDRSRAAEGGVAGVDGDEIRRLREELAAVKAEKAKELAAVKAENVEKLAAVEAENAKKIAAVEAENAELRALTYASLPSAGEMLGANNNNVLGRMNSSAPPTAALPEVHPRDQDAAGLSFSPMIDTGDFSPMSMGASGRLSEESAGTVYTGISAESANTCMVNDVTQGLISVGDLDGDGDNGGDGDGSDRRRTADFNDVSVLFTPPPPGGVAVGGRRTTFGRRRRRKSSGRRRATMGRSSSCGGRRSTSMGSRMKDGDGGVRSKAIGVSYTPESEEANGDARP